MTGSVSRPSASPGPPDGIRSIETRSTRPRKPVDSRHGHLRRQRTSRAGATCCGRCIAPALPSCFRTPGTWPRREPSSRLDFPWSRPPAGAWPRRSAMRTTRVRRRTRCSPRPRGSQGSVEVPVTVDAEAGYGMEPAELVAALRIAGAAGCNLEDTDHAAGALRDPDRHAEWLGAVRQAASANGYQPRHQRSGRRLPWSFPRRRRSRDPGGARSRGVAPRECVPRSRRRLRLPDRLVGDGRAAAASCLRSAAR